MTASSPAGDTSRPCAECGAPHESADETGIRCELTPGHLGEHLAWQPVTWPQDDPAWLTAGRDTAGGEQT